MKYRILVPQNHENDIFYTIHLVGIKRQIAARTRNDTCGKQTICQLGMKWN